MPINATVKLCGAKARRNKHQPCRQPGMLTNGRCRLHGGKSTGPKTAAGKRKSARANLKDGMHTRAEKIERLRIRAMLNWRDDLNF